MSLMYKSIKLETMTSDSNLVGKIFGKIFGKKMIQTKMMYFPQCMQRPETKTEYFIFLSIL